MHGQQNIKKKKNNILALLLFRNVLSSSIKVKKVFRFLNSEIPFQNAWLP